MSSIRRQVISFLSLEHVAEKCVRFSDKNMLKIREIVHIMRLRTH